MAILISISSTNAAIQQTRPVRLNPFLVTANHVPIIIGRRCGNSGEERLVKLIEKNAGSWWSGLEGGV